MSSPPYASIFFYATLDRFMSLVVFYIYFLAFLTICISISSVLSSSPLNLKTGTELGLIVFCLQWH